MKLIIETIIILFVIIGWFISQVNEFTFIQKIVAPKYSRTIETINKMHSEGYILEGKDQGFKEISKILTEKHITNSANINITYIKTITWGTAFLETHGAGQETKPSITLEIGIKEQGTPIHGEIYGIKDEAGELFLPHIKTCGALIFWMGITLQVILALYEFFKEKT